MPGDGHGCGSADQAAENPADAFTDHTADGGEADYRCRCQRPVRFVKIENERDPQ
ncbi:hypothetical protein D3C76_1711510 [compost metagenome]